MSWVWSLVSLTKQNKNCPSQEGVRGWFTFLISICMKNLDLFCSVFGSSYPIILGVFAFLFMFYSLHVSSCLSSISASDIRLAFTRRENVVPTDVCSFSDVSAFTETPRDLFLYLIARTLSPRLLGLPGLALKGKNLVQHIPAPNKVRDLSQRREEQWLISRLLVNKELS